MLRIYVKEKIEVKDKLPQNIEIIKGPKNNWSNYSSSEVLGVITDSIVVRGPPAETKIKEGNYYL